jgi:hypothetical protein
MAENKYPLFIDNEGEEVGIFLEEWLEGESRIEFPEKFDDDEGFFTITKIELNDSCFVKLRRIRQSEYFVKKWKSAHLQPKPYKVIDNISEAKKMLGKKLKEFDIKDDEGYSSNVLEITFKDKTKKRLDLSHGNLESLFIEYYPEVGILILRDGCDGAEPIDLNDSEKEHDQVGHPFYHVVSPDRKLLINGYDNNACASEGATYFLEKWNPKKKKYEFVNHFYDLFEEKYIFTFATDWFWTNNSTVLFRYGWGKEWKYYEMEIIVK